MTDRMNDDALDRELREFLAWQAEQVVDAPTTTDMATRIAGRTGTRTIWPRVAPRLVWILLASLLVAALLGVATIGSGIVPAPGLPSYEAVFLRVEVVNNTPTVLVVGVNTEGQEREIARLEGAWAVYDIGSGPAYLVPMGAVSPSGLLALPSSRGAMTGTIPLMHWEVFDLHRPGVDPGIVPGIEQDIEQLRSSASFGERVDPRGGVFWGPGERLAIAWYERVPDPIDSSGSGLDRRLTFVAGRDGAATSVDIVDDLVLRAAWASDGSGVLIGEDTEGDPGRVLRPDGSERDLNGAVAEPSCRTRMRSGEVVTISDTGIGIRRPDGSVAELPSLDLVGIDGGDGFACVSPDDAAIVHNVDMGQGGGRVTAARPLAELILPEGGRSFEIQGSFAGWLAVYP